jgi:hypothetical protein
LISIEQADRDYGVSARKGQDGIWHLDAAKTRERRSRPKSSAA